MPSSPSTIDWRSRATGGEYRNVWPTIRDPVARVGLRDELAGVSRGHGQRLLDHGVAAGVEALARQLGVEGGGSGHDHRLDLGLVERRRQVGPGGDAAEGTRSRRRAGARPSRRRRPGGAPVDAVDVAGQVGPPVAVPDERDADAGRSWLDRVERCPRRPRPGSPRPSRRASPGSRRRAATGDASWSRGPAVTTAGDDHAGVPRRSQRRRTGDRVGWAGGPGANRPPADGGGCDDMPGPQRARVASGDRAFHRPYHQNWRPRAGSDDRGGRSTRWTGRRGAPSTSRGDGSSARSRSCARASRRTGPPRPAPRRGRRGG